MNYNRIVTEKVTEYISKTGKRPNIVAMDKTTYRVFSLSEDYIPAIENKFNVDMFLGLSVAIIAGEQSSELRVGRV